MVYANFAQLFETLNQNPVLKTVAAVCPDDKATLEALKVAMEKKICRCLMIGNAEKITSIWQEIGGEENDLVILPASEPADAAAKATAAIRRGEADFIMKGNLDTSILLRAVVDKVSGLREDHALVSHLAFLEIPGYHKLMVLTDSGMIPYPTLDQKKQIISNAVNMLKKMGYTQIKIGVLAAVEKVQPKIKETVEADALANFNRQGEWPEAIVEERISYDLLMSKEIAMKKNYQTQIAGDADVMLVDQMTTGNILGKALIITAGAKMAGLVVGARVPIALNSRGSSMDEKLQALMLAAMVS